MPPVHVQSRGADSQSHPVSLAFLSDLTAGNTIVAALGYTENGVRVTGVTDTQGHTWASLQGVIGTGSGSSVDLWWARNVSAGPCTVTATFGGAKSGIGIAILEYAGLGTAGTLLDQTNSQQTVAATSLPHGSITTTTAVQLILTAMRVVGTHTATIPGDYTARRNTNGTNSVIVLERVTAAAETTNPTITMAVNETGHGLIVSLKQQASDGFSRAWPFIGAAVGPGFLG